MTERSRQNATPPAAAVQNTETTTQKAGKLRAKFSRRLAPADLSDRVRERIVSLVVIHEDYERVAEIACREFPGIRFTASLVLGVFVLGVRRPPAFEVHRSQRAA